MLVLSRSPDEKILLPSVPVVIKVISSQAGLTRLGIQAPSHVPILREELCSDGWAGPADPEALSPAGASPPAFAQPQSRPRPAAALQLMKNCDPAVQQTLDRLGGKLDSLRRQHPAR